jgi:hypothetical protein
MPLAAIIFGLIFLGALAAVSLMHFSEYKRVKGMKSVITKEHKKFFNVK